MWFWPTILVVAVGLLGFSCRYWGWLARDRQADREMAGIREDNQRWYARCLSAERVSAALRRQLDTVGEWQRIAEAREDDAQRAAHAAHVNGEWWRMRSVTAERALVAFMLTVSALSRVPRELPPGNQETAAGARLAADPDWAEVGHDIMLGYARLAALS